MRLKLFLVDCFMFLAWLVIVYALFFWWVPNGK